MHSRNLTCEGTYPGRWPKESNSNKVIRGWEAELFHVEVRQLEREASLGLNWNPDNDPKALNDYSPHNQA